MLELQKQDQHYRKRFQFWFAVFMFSPRAGNNWGRVDSALNRPVSLQLTTMSQLTSIEAQYVLHSYQKIACG
jgi:hypothetical protein